MKQLQTFLRNHLLPVHPFLFSLYPIVALYSLNAGQSHIADALSILGVKLVSVSLLLPWRAG